MKGSNTPFFFTTKSQKMNRNIVVIFVLLIFSVSLLSCSQREKEIEKYRKIGTEIAQETQKSLAANLMENMKSAGVEAAIPFCNTMANPLTKEMEDKYSAKIKRVSLKNRNANNAPSEQEAEILVKYNDLLNSAKSLDPIVEIKTNNEVQYYAPIIIQEKCLACHGSLEKELTSETDSIIKSLYPNDKATGYKAGELRGIWSITIKK